MPDGYTEEDVRLVADALWEETLGADAGYTEGPPAESCYYTDARAVLKALASSGRLLPEGAEHFANYVVRWFGPDFDGGFVDWGCASLEHARTLAGDPPAGAVKGEIRSMHSWVGPWSVVEPVAVKEAGDAA